MNYCEAQAGPALQKYVKRFWALEYESAVPLAEPETVLPDGCPEIVFNLSDRFQRLHSDFDETQPATLFAGQMSRSISIRPTGRVSLFGVRFHPAGVFPLFGGSMHELTNNIIDASDVLGPSARELEERVAESSTFNKRVAVFEDYFSRMLSVRPVGDEIAAVATRMIVESGGAVSITRLTESVGVSERSLERSFKRFVGISPKMLARTVRFQNVLGKIRSAENADLLDAALSSGYFDQSHMIREFREFSGETPVAYLKKTHDISDVFTAA